MTKTRHIVLTGCTRGLGLALVGPFVAAGHWLTGCGRSAHIVDRIKKTHPEQTAFSVLDVSDDAAVADWAEITLKVQGTPDLLINNAAVINEPGPLWSVSHEDFQQLMAINVNGIHSVIRHFLPAMIDRGEGMVVNISSGWGRSAEANVGPYCASKWAVEGLTKALSEELPCGLSAVAVSPGVIDTAMLRQVWGEQAAAFSNTADWAKQAAPFFLSLNSRHNGQSLTVPG